MHYSNPTGGIRGGAGLRESLFCAPEKNTLLVLGGFMGLPPENRIDIAAALRQATYDGPIWSVNSEQLNVNLLRLSSGEGVSPHINNELDVLLVVFEGIGELIVDGDTLELQAGLSFLVPRGASRGIRCISGPLVYLTAHRRRAGLMPT